MYYSRNTLKYTFISKSIRYWKVEFPRNCSNVNIHCSFGFFPCFFIRVCMNTDKVTLSRCNNCKLHSNGSHHHFILWLTNDKLICYATEPMQIVIWKIMIEILQTKFLMTGPCKTHKILLKVNTWPQDHEASQNL